MTALEIYLCDGAEYQARATLAFLQGKSTIESSWDEKTSSYKAQPTVARWENCREQGYVVMLRNEKRDQVNIAFFEHRNNDSITAVEWKQSTINSPTIETAQFGKTYKDKFDVSHSTRYGEALEMAEWILRRLTAHWDAGCDATTPEK